MTHVHRAVGVDHYYTTIDYYSLRSYNREILLLEYKQQHYQ